MSDGILTALVLGAGHMIAGRTQVTWWLALCVSMAAAISGLFIFDVAHYAELRSELLEAERQLNLTQHGRLVATRLGRAAFIDALMGALVAGGSTFARALMPLSVTVMAPRSAFLSIGAALAALAVLGYLLARTVYGRPLHWMLALVLGGAVLACMGVKMDIA
ncbi:hypothetical protein [Paraburkholderia tropica]|uniref:hypothetical protein n=1 Tax=Paraburkholderia tropica TaxID=92647 RepID=UPI002AB7220B|nr:hypothetical protein [Paraburkholderia tropica]